MNLIASYVIVALAGKSALIKTISKATIRVIQALAPRPQDESAPINFRKLYQQGNPGYGRFGIDASY